MGTYLFRGPKFWRVVVPTILLAGVAGLVFAFSSLIGPSSPRGPRTSATASERDGHTRGATSALANRDGERRGNRQADADDDASSERTLDEIGGANARGTNAGGTGSGSGNETGTSNGRMLDPRVIVTNNSLRVPGLNDLVSKVIGATGSSRRGLNGSDSDGPHGATEGEGDGEGDADEEAEPATTGSVTGVVTARESDGAVLPVSGLTVMVLLSETADPATASPDQLFATVTNASGAYRVDNVPPGPIKVTIPTESQLYYEPITRYGVVAAGEEVRIDLFVTKEFDLAGRCYGPDGLPMKGATIRLWPSGGFNAGRGAPAFTVVTNDFGVFQLKELPDENYRLSADKAGYSSVVVEKFRPSDHGPQYPLEIHFSDDLVISGAVTDDFNQPVEGARVTARHFEEGNLSWTSTVLTDVDGTYTLPVEADSMNNVICELTGYNRQVVQGILPGRRGLDFRLIANGKGGASGRVMDVDGRLATHFTVNNVLFENPDGAFDVELGDGDHVLTIRSTRTGGVARVPVTVQAPAVSSVGLVQLIPGRRVKVEVVQAIDAATTVVLEDARVRLDLTGQVVTEREGGWYVFDAVPTDVPVTFTAIHPQFPARQVTLQPETPLAKSDEWLREAMPGSVDQPFVMIAMQAGARATNVLVRDLAGAPLVGASVEWLAGNSQSGPTWATGTDGIAQLTGLSGANAKLRVSASGFVTQDITVPTVNPDNAPDGVPTTEVVLQAGGSVWGEVTALGLPLPGDTRPTIRLQPVNGGAEMVTTPVQITLPDATVSWRYEFRNVPIGQFWLSADYNIYARELHTLTEGQTTRVDLNFPGRGTLTVRLEEANGAPAVNRTAYLYTLDTWTVVRYSTSGPDGRVHYPLLPPGQWVVSVITHGSSDQRMYQVDLPGGAMNVEHVIRFPVADSWIDGRVLIENPEVPYSESANAAPAGVTDFELAVRLPDDETIRVLQCSISGGVNSAADAAQAINQSSDATGLGLMAEAEGNLVKIMPVNANALPFFAVTPNDANAEAVFGPSPFQSSHAASNCKVSLEHLDVPLQTLLAGYISVDPLGYYRLGELSSGLYRPRVAAHYTGVAYAEAFGRDVTVPASGTMPFVTMWTTGDGSFADVHGTLRLAGGGHSSARSTIVYVDDLDEQPTVYPPSPGERSPTKRLGYFFGQLAGTAGHFDCNRLRRGRRYQAVVHVEGMLPVTVEFEVPASGPATINLPAVDMTWDPRFDARNQ